MRVSVFGLGYAGCISAVCLAHDGHTVIGVDVSQPKLDLLAAGQPPVSEPGLAERLAAVVASGQLRPGRDAETAVLASDVSLICVGTPGDEQGVPNLTYVETVCREVGSALAHTSDYHVVIVRSTVLPGTTEEQLLPLLEQTSRRRAGPDFGLVVNPEFLREGSALEDYYYPSTILIGAIDARCAAVAENLYRAIEAPVVRTTPATAEMVKYASNAFHAAKVAFANEIGNLSRLHGADGQTVMDIVCRDQRLNLSPAYLRPGPAFGGSCLPKDLRALARRARARGLEAPVLEAVLRSNQLQIERSLALIKKSGCRRIGILGLSYKPNTDDVRDSPSLALITALVQDGYDVSVYDERVAPGQLIGANRDFMERELPQIAALVRPSIEAVVRQAEVVVIANGSAAFRQAPRLMRAGQLLVDLVGMAKGESPLLSEYAGLCW